MKFLEVPYIDQTANGAYTGCESVSAVMLLNYLGYDTGMNEFIDRYLDKADFEMREGVLYGPDPRKVFAGDPYDKEAMGCYAPVIRNSLERVLKDAYTVTDETGRTVPELAAQYIDHDMPVVIWATIYMRDIVIGPSWKLFDSGEEFVWRSNEHCLLLVGYTDTEYILNDPWENSGVIRVEKGLFEERFRAQHSQAVGVTKK